MKDDMICPKCGGQAAKYDENKWICPRCGNKFIMVNVVDQPTYELDVQNAKPAKPIVKLYSESNLAESPTNMRYRNNEHNSCLAQIKIYRKQILRKQYKKYFLGFAIILFSILTIVGTIVGIATKSSRLLIICVLPALICLHCLRLYFRVRQQIIDFQSSLNESEIYRQDLEQQIVEVEERQKEEVTVGYQPVCPNCMADVGDPSPSPPSGLTHCLKCGKQFHYSSQFSYPIKFK